MRESVENCMQSEADDDDENTEPFPWIAAFKDWTDLKSRLCLNSKSKN